MLLICIVEYGNKKCSSMSREIDGSDSTKKVAGLDIDPRRKAAASKKRDEEESSLVT